MWKELLSMQLRFGSILVSFLDSIRFWLLFLVEVHLSLINLALEFKIEENRIQYFLNNAVVLNSCFKPIILMEKSLIEQTNEYIKTYEHIWMLALKNGM